MATFVNDTFSGEVGTTVLSAHTGEAGATWTVHPSYTEQLNVSAITNSVFCSNTAVGSCYYTSGIPASSEYDVQADFVTDFSLGGIANFAGIAGRISTSADTFYMARYSASPSRWELYKAVSGTFTLLGTYSQSLSDNSSYTVRLEITDATKKVFVDGVERISSTDNAITAAGRAGMRWRNSTTNQTGLRLDNFSATDISAASGVTGTGATTTAGDTQTASGTVTKVGTGSTTTAGDTQSASGTKSVVGTSAVTAGDIIHAGAGDSGDPPLEPGSLVKTGPLNIGGTFSGGIAEPQYSTTDSSPVYGVSDG